LIYSETDEILIPHTSPWFQHYALGQDVKVVSFKDTDQYKYDWLGLKTLDRLNRLQMYPVPCGHVEIVEESCKVWYNKYTKPLLNNNISCL